MLLTRGNVEKLLPRIWSKIQWNSKQNIMIYIQANTIEGSVLRD